VGNAVGVSDVWNGGWDYEIWMNWLVNFDDNLGVSYGRLREEFSREREIALVDGKGSAVRILGLEKRGAKQTRFVT
jgi:hypothetical protein